MSAKNLDSGNFDEFISSGASVVDFYADWCGPCKLLKPVFEEISDEMKDVKFGRVDVEKEHELAQRFQVMSIPTIIFFKNKEQVDRATGFMPKEDLAEKAKSL